MYLKETAELLRIYRPGFIILCLTLLIYGCSSSGFDSSLLPAQEENPVLSKEMQSARVLLGVWDLYLDLSTNSVKVEFIRNGSIHVNVTQMVQPPQCMDCLTIVVNSFNPSTRVMDIDVGLRNPTGISGYDVRGIMFTNDLGHKLGNGDEWTAYFDIPGGDVINPFKAYAKDQPEREFAGFAQYTENYLVHIPDNPQYSAIKYAVDACWPGHCKEPYEITGFSQTTINDSIGASGVVEIIVHDWQDDVDSVKLGVYEITGEDFIDFTNAGEGKWLLTLTNSQGAKAGEYTGKIVATSANSGDMALYDSVVIEISGVEHNGWVRVWGGLSGIFGEAVATDYKGNVFVASRFSGTIDFDPGPGVYEQTCPGSCDISLSKFTPTGAFSWALNFGGSSADVCNALAVDSVGNIYLVGFFSSEADFDPGPGVDEHSSVGDADAFLCKLSSYGDFLWARTWGGEGYDSADAVAIDNQGNVCVSGIFEGDADLDPGEGIEIHHSNGEDDIFLSKLTSYGDFCWAQTWGGFSDDVCSDVDFDGSCDIYIGGHFSSDKVDFDPGEGSDEHENNGHSDIYISKFKYNGDFKWARTWGGPLADELGGIGVDFSGNIFATGSFANTVDFDPGSGVDEHTSVGLRDAFLSKLDSNGLYGWTMTWGGDSAVSGDGMAYSTDGITYVCGRYLKTVDFDPGPGQDNHTSGNNFNVFLSKFDLDGIWQWTRTWGEAGTCEGWDIAVDPDNNAYITGGFMGTIDFDPGPEKDEHTNNYNSMDAYISKFPPGGDW